MDDSATRMKANMEKVLRAMDVIPPFRPDGTQNDRRADSMQQVSSPPQAERRRRAPSQTPGGEASGHQDKQTTGKITIPEFDLGERILAAQRRMTAKKRKAPSSPEIEQGSHVEAAAVVPRMPLACPSGDDLVQLERIVADIVAGDIERLCTGPAKALN